MTDDHMRVEFEAWADTKWGRHDGLWSTWQAAYHAGMERAAKVCEEHDYWFADEYTAAIRKEMK